jgi:hypothetical protein
LLLQLYFWKRQLAVFLRWNSEGYADKEEHEDRENELEIG